MAKILRHRSDGVNGVSWTASLPLSALRSLRCAICLSQSLPPSRITNLIRKLLSIASDTSVLHVSDRQLISWSDTVRQRNRWRYKHGKRKFRFLHLSSTTHSKFYLFLIHNGSCNECSRYLQLHPRRSVKSPEVRW